jgi:murein DD-endopeptidase MepM/ murein hydrolase activator NlpD
LKNALFRAIAYSTIGLMAFFALQIEPPASFSPASRFSQPVIEVPQWQTRADTLDGGETLSELFSRLGLDGNSATAALGAATTLDARRVPAGMPVTARLLPTDSVPTEIVLQLAIDRYLRLTRTDSGWVGQEESLPWMQDTVMVRGVVQSNLYAAMDAGAAGILRAQAGQLLTFALASLYDYRVDMSRDLQAGDEFRVLFERLTGPGGVERIGNILAASMVLSGRETQAFRFEASGSGDTYFDQTGRPMKSGFLRSPLAFSRISSNFGMRRHPVLGTWRNHAGTDYAASPGSPVRAIGDGSVVFAGLRGSYGNVVDIRHRNGFVSRYAHLRGFARGVRSGMPVARESVIGYVGQTGLATGPHLHFEILVNGSQRNPRTLLAGVQTEEPIPAAAMAQFATVRSLLLASLNGMVGVVRVAQQY